MTKNKNNGDDTLNASLTKTSGRPWWLAESHLIGLLSSGLAKKCHITHKEHDEMIRVSAHKACLGFCSCPIDGEWQELLMQTIFTSNLDSNQFISPPLLTLTTCSSYLLHTQSPVSHVAGASGQRSPALITVLDYCDLQKSCNPKSDWREWRERLFGLFRIAHIHSYSQKPSFGALLILCGSVYLSRVDLWDFTWSNEQLLWKVRVSVLSPVPRSLHPMSRCPVLQLHVRQHPPHNSHH